MPKPSRISSITRKYNIINCNKFTFKTAANKELVDISSTQQQTEPFKQTAKIKQQINPYKLSSTSLLELNKQLDELVSKGYIKPSN